MIVYKVQYRESSETAFRDDGDWASCEECISRMRTLFEQDFRRDLRVVDDRGVVVASTSGTPQHPHSDTARTAAPPTSTPASSPGH